MVDLALTAGGIVLLFLGGELLVRGSVGLAERLGISPLVIGLTIVGFGTSAPELSVSVGAAVSGAPGIALGNVVGSNIANILLILGIAAVIRPLAVARPVFVRDGMVMLAASVALVVVGLTGTLGGLTGGLFLVGLAGFLALAFVTGRAAPEAAPYGDEATQVRVEGLAVWKGVVCVVAGLGLLVGGAQMLVEGATAIARGFGVSEAVIGLTLVAVGTSLPELATSVIAALRGHADVAVGNVVGSNVFNILGILGVTALVAPIPVDPRIAALDLWVMLGVAVLGLALLRTGWRLGRAEGVIFLALYAGYAASMVMA